MQARSPSSETREEKERPNKDKQTKRRAGGHAHAAVTIAPFVMPAIALRSFLQGVKATTVYLVGGCALPYSLPACHYLPLPGCACVAAPPTIKREKIKRGRDRPKGQQGSHEDLFFFCLLLLPSLSLSSSLTLAATQLLQHVDGRRDLVCAALYPGHEVSEMPPALLVGDKGHFDGGRALGLCQVTQHCTSSGVVASFPTAQTNSSNAYSPSMACSARRRALRHERMKHGRSRGH